MHMHTVANAGRITDRREGRLVAQFAGNEADEFAGDQRMVGNGDALLGPHRHLELAGTEFLEDRVGRHARLAHRGDDRLAEMPLFLEAAERESLADVRNAVPELEFMLEGAIERNTCHPVQPLKGGLQDRARAELPGPSVGIADVAEDKILLRRALPAFYADAGRWIGNEHEIAERAKGAFGDGVEAGDLNIGRRPADALLQALFHLRQWKGLAAHLA